MTTEKFFLFYVDDVKQKVIIETGNKKELVDILDNLNNDDYVHKMLLSEEELIKLLRTLYDYTDVEELRRK